ncbi:zonular occludens toxin domain-containing protein [Aeromonas cavernicola]|uniref:Toxin n=1 Tax=Aeromonas cavernicola TaxID=1006623 RepID=A0A2H9U469_9GAMM|nr:zonular occludens toxin domain-containing protein [Aeromonas cavernicola]PJG58827.1 toxin [Aeromonas cavernicola]
MAIVIEHGHNGSYKSSSVIWYRLLPALRAGRLVVTNVAGMYPLHRIEEFLGEKFPDGARLFRISSQDPRYQELWRRWHHWMPIGAFVFIDECQDIYDRDVFKGQPDYDLKPIDTYSDVLPADFIQLFKDTLEKFKPTEFDDCDTDDTGRIVFDERGRIIYPTTPKESFMRHRHYNWDVVFATPDITSIPRPVRSCCEVAFAYSSKDSFFFSKRKPRIYEHNPLENGIPTRQSITFKRHVPLAVHRLYKSTQTGSITKSGQSTGPLSSFKIRFVLFIVLPAILLGWGWFIFKNMFSESDISKTGTAVVSEGRSGSPADTVALPVSLSTNSAVGAESVFMTPYGVTELYTNGASGAIYYGRFEGLVLFSGKLGDDELVFNSDDLINMGYRVDWLGDCYTVVTDKNGRSVVVNCPPRVNKPQAVAGNRQLVPDNVNTFATLAAPAA